MLETAPPPTIFTATSAYSLAGVAGIGLVAFTASRALLPKNARSQDRFTFIWLVRVLYLPIISGTHRLIREVLGSNRYLTRSSTSRLRGRSCGYRYLGDR